METVPGPFLPTQHSPTGVWCVCTASVFSVGFSQEVRDDSHVYWQEWCSFTACSPALSDLLSWATCWGGFNTLTRSVQARLGPGHGSCGWYQAGLLELPTKSRAAWVCSWWP